MEANVVRFLILWKGTPENVEAFDRHYREVHIPLAKQLTGLRRYTLSKSVSPVRGGEAFYRVAELEWDDMAAFQHAFASLEGQATGKDMATLVAMCPDVSSIVYEVEDV
jgi:uncharacterized protein (TIGR02118 family)